jgi:hypothetical protein
MLSLSGKLTDYKGKRVGLIFDGPNVVGTFETFTCEDCFGKRKIGDITMYAARWDVAKSRTRQPLEFCFVEVIDYHDNKVKMIERFGFGILEKPNSLFTDLHFCNMRDAVWSKCPENFRYAN